jgi:anti-sigma regulatory factor (Ser/Thr protein kinase)
MRASFPRKIDSTGKIHDRVAAFFLEQEIDAEHRFAVDLAVEEIFTNMVKYNPGGGGEIEVALEREGDRLTVRLVDPDSEPFDITRAAEIDPDLPLQQRPIGGLGLHLVRKMIDEIDYAYAKRRSTITLSKRIR